MVARFLEGKGIPTLCLGSAYDILNAGKAPRSVFLDYPLGHSCGKPFSEKDQDDVLEQAVKLFEQITEPGNIVILDKQWEDDNWRIDASSTAASDTRQPRDQSPQFQHAADYDAAVASGAI